MHTTSGFVSQRPAPGCAPAEKGKRGGTASGAPGVRPCEDALPFGPAVGALGVRMCRMDFPPFRTRCHLRVRVPAVACAPSAPTACRKTRRDSSFFACGRCADASFFFVRLLRVFSSSPPLLPFLPSLHLLAVMLSLGSAGLLATFAASGARCFAPAWFARRTLPNYGLRALQTRRNPAPTSERVAHAGKGQSSGVLESIPEAILPGTAPRG